MTIQQISVFLENRAGQLAEITRILAENGVDLRAIHIAETKDYGVLRIVASRPQEAANILLKHGFILSMTPVLAVAVPDHPGGLSKLLDIVVEDGMDIEYMYSMFGQKNGMAYMIFRVADTDCLEKLFAASGIASATGEDLGIG